MVTEPKIQKIYTEIQRQLFYLIPEKWSKVYLYSSIIEQPGNVETGELYFYYIPQGILKKNPVNAYEIPSKFSIGETQYLRLIDKLYQEIKQLHKACIEAGEKKWHSIMIAIADFQFTVEYNYDDLKGSNFNSYERHIIFRYQYLEYPYESFSKEEKEIIRRYLEESKSKKPNIKTYSEAMYEKPFETIEIGSKHSNIQYVKDDDIRLLAEKTDFKSQILKSNE